MRLSRLILAAGFFAAATPAFAQQVYYREVEGRGYVERIIVDERFREPVYDVRSEPRYAPPPSRRAYTPVYQDERGNGRMYYDPYSRGRIRGAGDPSRRTSREAQPPAGYGRAPDPQFRKQVVQYDGPGRPGSILIDTKTRFLYLINTDGTALRYGVGVGRAGFAWTGEHKVTNKQEWPTWHPPAEMRVRRPDLPAMMEGGPNNPLGARALYLGSTLYRIHGSNEPWTIGQAVSSGCFRMTNEDVQDLYERVPVGASVKVI